MGKIWEIKKGQCDMCMKLRVATKGKKLEGYLKFE
jgi:hypothetical protein